MNPKSRITFKSFTTNIAIRPNHLRMMNLKKVLVSFAFKTQLKFTKHKFSLNKKKLFNP